MQIVIEYQQKRAVVTRYFSALLAFMVIFSIGGAMFNGFATERGVVVTVLLALLGGAIGYFLGSDGSRNKD